MSKYFAHESAFIDEPCQIGVDTKIWHFCHIMAGAKIGKGCTLGQNIYIDSHVSVGNNVKIQNNVSVFKGVTIENNVFCGPSCVFTNVNNPRSEFPKDLEEFKETIVREGATIGANSTIICGVSIGRYAFVGAGAVVTKDVPNYALVLGNPARRVGWVSEAGAKLEFVGSKSSKSTCSITGDTYQIITEERVQKIEL